MSSLDIAASPPTRRDETVQISLLLAFAGGYLDAYTWIVHGVMANAQTANLVLLWVYGTAANGHEPSTLLLLLPHSWWASSLPHGCVGPQEIGPVQSARLSKFWTTWTFDNPVSGVSGGFPDAPLPLRRLPLPTGACRAGNRQGTA